ncbi:hypothetical protein FKR81_37540 [Lentzea tibetensis]|uniref:DNA primase/polymerase bifunctional N-terminal domain-containing protein n=1 Tax=Lentzea tibetensis TaxID=2591470 RepID=A0A563EHH6_9PSEU|nr:hypothetical protein [Lentzea tibetensis]TWP46074.1 hypothetical protein FKR81_37540 [Lentzea tibetensis]
MNTTSTMQTQLDFLRELSDMKARYEESLGWPVSVDVGRRRLVVPAGREFDAVTMPSHLAEAVRAQLCVAMLWSPLVAAPGGQWLTFLTTPARASRPNLAAELRRARVQLVPRGGQVVIPASFDTHHDHGEWRWVEPPLPRRALPPWSAVIAVARRADSGSHHGGAG